MTDPLLPPGYYATIMLGKNDSLPCDCVEYDTYDVQHAVKEHMRKHKKPTVVYQDEHKVWIPK